MAKYIGYVVCVLIIAGLTYQRVEMQKENTALRAQVQKLENSLQKEHATETKLQNEIQKDQQARRNELALKEGQLQQLAQNLKNEQLKLDAIKDRLAGHAPAANNGPAIQAQIQRDQDRLKELNRRLAEYKQAERDSFKEGNQNVDLHKKQTNAAVKEINEQIKAQQQAINATNKDIAYWKKRTKDVNQNMHLDELSKKLDEQRQGLDTLNYDKAHLEQNELQHAREVKTTVQQEKMNLQDTEEQIHEQIKNTEADLKQLQGNLGKDKTAKEADSREVKALRDSYSLQSQRVQDLNREYEAQKSAYEKLKAF